LGGVQIKQWDGNSTVLGKHVVTLGRAGDEWYGPGTIYSEEVKPGERVYIGDGVQLGWWRKGGKRMRIFKCNVTDIFGTHGVLGFSKQAHTSWSVMNQTYWISAPNLP
jgi:hypothetical protein